MKDDKSFMSIEGHRVGVSHPSKILWPENRITKSMLVDYYQSISSHILPFLKNRPLSLLRHPRGIEKKSFYHKDAGEDVPSWIKVFPFRAASTGKIIDYIVCNNAATLAYLNNLDCIELNPWHSIIRKPDNPDYLVIDLDPSDQNDFGQVMQVAHVFHALMQEHAVECYCKTSGASGLHLFIPLGGRLSYDTVRILAHDICVSIHAQIPSFTTMERSLKKRGGRIYLDYLQNSKGQTIASVFSIRPRPGAPVSMPIEWTELKEGLLPSDFNMMNSKSLIPERARLFKGILGKPAKLVSLQAEIVGLKQ
jgi:bifunctional non-homologous end joining protein LigD